MEKEVYPYSFTDAQLASYIAHQRALDKQAQHLAMFIGVSHRAWLMLSDVQLATAAYRGEPVTMQRVIQQQYIAC